MIRNGPELGMVLGPRQASRARKKALVIGGGIGGPTAAMALQRVGIEAVVYEAADAPADYAGLFLNMASNGLDALRTLGIDVAARADGVPIPRMVMWSGTGKRLGEVANGLRLPDGTVSVVVRRGVLQRVLREEAERRDIDVVFGKRLVSYEVIGGGVVARFADGTEAEGNLLIGADGIHSRTRGLLDPQAPSPNYTGLLSLGGYSHTTTTPPTPETQHFVFGQHAFFGYLVRESGEVYWFANLPRPVEPTREELAATSTEDWRRHLVEAFADDTPMIAETIGATDGEIGAYSVHDLSGLRTWHRGPVALVGDAAHAVSPNAGQGASLAVEDALVLGRSARDAPDSEEALATYVSLRRERAEKVVAYSRKIGGAKTAGSLARRMRDLAMPFALKHFASPQRQSWMYDYRVEWERAAA